MLAQAQLATTNVTPLLVLAQDMPYGVVIVMHNASVSSITAEAYLDGNGGDKANSERIGSFTIAAGATQPFEIHGRLAAGATFSFAASAASALNVIILEATGITPS